MTYEQFAETFRWDKVKRQWFVYKCPPKTMHIARLRTAHPADTERFCLRLLVVQPDCVGCTSYADIRTCGAKVYDTYKARRCMPVVGHATI